MNVNAEWAIVDGLRFTSKRGPKTCHHNFDPRGKITPRLGISHARIRVLDDDTDYRGSNDVTLSVPFQAIREASMY